MKNCQRGGIMKRQLTPQEGMELDKVQSAMHSVLAYFYEEVAIKGKMEAVTYSKIRHQEGMQALIDPKVAVSRQNSAIITPGAYLNTQKMVILETMEDKRKMGRKFGPLHQAMERGFKQATKDPFASWENAAREVAIVAQREFINKAEFKKSNPTAGTSTQA